MAASKRRERRLWDTYAFGVFRVQPTVRGVFGDPKARLVSLVRRSKKQHAGAAQGYNRVGTTEEPVGCETCRVGIRGCTWSSKFAGYFVEAPPKRSGSSWRFWRTTRFTPSGLPIMWGGVAARRPSKT